MDSLDLLLLVTFILAKTENLVKSALNVVQLTLLSYGLTCQVLDSIRLNRDIQEMVDFHSAVALSADEPPQETGEGPVERKPEKKKDLKAMLDDPAFLERFEEYTQQFLRQKEERKVVLTIVDSLRKGTVDMNIWDEVEATILALVELDEDLLDLMLEKIFSNGGDCKTRPDFPEGTHSVNEHKAREMHAMRTLLWKSAAFASGSDIASASTELRESARTGVAESSGMGATWASTPPGDSAIRPRVESLLSGGVLDPQLIGEAAVELIKDHPNKKQDIPSFLEDLNLKCNLWRQLDLYRRMQVVCHRSSSGIRQKVKEGGNGNSSSPMVTGGVDTGVELERCRDELVYLILELLKRKEAKVEELGAESGGGDHWMVEEVDRELDILQTDVTRMFEGIGDEDTVRKIVKVAMDLMQQKLSRNSKLLEAVKSGRESLLRILINAKGDRCSVALELAAMLGYDDIVRDLVKAGTVVSDRCLNFAMANGHADVVRSILSSGASIADSGERLLSDALISGKKDVVKVLIEFGTWIYNDDALLKALRRTVEDGNLGCVEVVLNAGKLEPTVDMLDLTRVAAEKGHLGLYRYLIGVLFQGYELGDLIGRLPHKSKLPFSQVVDYRIATHYKTRCRSLSLDRRFPVTSEVPGLPGYGNVLNTPCHIAKQCAEFCERVVVESVDFDKIRAYQFPLSLMKCGSSAEGTKVGLPDEVDFLFLLHTNPVTIIVKDIGEGYKQIKVAEEYEDIPTRRLISAGSKLFHDVFVGLVMTQERHKDRIKSTQKIVTVGGSASSEWVLRYDVDAEHSLDISVDLVPVVHVHDWPPDAVISTWMMDHATLASEGYALVAKPPSRYSEFGKTIKAVEQQRMWRISFAHLETKHLACLEQRVKDVYITCKSLRDPDICRILFKDNQGMSLSTSKDLITSYMLKMVFMHNVKRFLEERKSLVEMVYIVFNQLAQCIAAWYVPFFWQPRVNVLEGLRHEPAQCKQAAKVMQSLATALFLRDGETDTVVEELTKDGGVYPYLSARLSGAHSSPPNSNHNEGYVINEHPPGELNFSEDDDECVEIVIYSRADVRDEGYTVYQLN